MDHHRGGAGLPEFGAKPCAISFEPSTNPRRRRRPAGPATRTLIDPFDGSSRDLHLPVTEATTCLRCFGDWALMLDEDTSDCFLLDLASLSTVSLPPLLEPLPSSPPPGFALSSPAPPDCTVAVVARDGDEFLLHCRPGDAKWSKFSVRGDTFLPEIHGSRGFIYATSSINWELIVIDMDSSAGVHVDKTNGGEDTRYVPAAYAERCPLPADCLSQWVESRNGGIFLLRINFHGIVGCRGFRDLDIHRFDPNKLSFELVESIGDTTIFASMMGSIAVSPATAAGTQPDCVHLLHPFPDEGALRLYTISLRDRTVTFSLVHTNSEAPVHWAIPQSLRLGQSKSPGVITVGTPGALSKKLRQSFSCDAYSEDNASPWSSLNIDYFEMLAPKLSVIDCLHLRAVCRYWSKITKPIIQEAKSYPMLMSICSNSGDKYRLFDPMTEKEYNLNQGKRLFYGDKKLLVLYSKCGWVIITEGRNSVTALNPFTGEVFSLPPPAELPLLNGISFSSPPTSPDSMVLMFHKSYRYQVGEMLVWHAGDEEWTFLDLKLHTNYFTLIYSNLVFFEGEFYCLGSLGNLAVFNPSDLKCRVLNKPECIYEYVDRLRIEDCRGHLVEFRGELIAVFLPQYEAPIEMFKLDRRQMVWTKLDRLDDATMFVDNWGATIIQQSEYTLCNRIYLPKYGFGEDGDAKVSAYYDLVSQQYYPAFYGLMEPMNSIWVEPNLKHSSCS
ncbi:hypothetical protein ACP70R_042304 [Stipagrostis hirtigluma subsp. patula]